MRHINQHTKFITGAHASPSRRLTRLASALAALAAWLLVSLPNATMAAETLNSNGSLCHEADVTMGVSQLTADGAQCGLEPGRIGEAAHQVVVAGGIALRDDSTNRVVISAVTTRVGPDQCATALLLGVYAKESFPASSAAGSSGLSLWQRRRWQHRSVATSPP